jgi:hypothetical protein
MYKYIYLHSHQHAPYTAVPPGSANLIGTVTNMPRGVFSLDWSPTEDKVAIGTGDGSVRILAVVDRLGGAGNHEYDLVDVAPRQHNHEGKEGEGKDDEGKRSD